MATFDAARRAYVCGFLVNDAELVVLLRKLTPRWQAGRLNGVGGKVEPDESPDLAMRREWGEETGDDTSWPWLRFAVQEGADHEVHFYLARCARHPALPDRNDVGERFEYRYANEIISGAHTCIPNLAWLLALALRDPVPLFVTARERL